MSQSRDCDRQHFVVLSLTAGAAMSMLHRNFTASRTPLTPGTSEQKHEINRKDNKILMLQAARPKTYMTCGNDVDSVLALQAFLELVQLVLQFLRFRVMLDLSQAACDDQTPKTLRSATSHLVQDSQTSSSVRVCFFLPSCHYCYNTDLRSKKVLKQIGSRRNKLW